MQIVKNIFSDDRIWTDVPNDVPLQAVHKAVAEENRGFCLHLKVFARPSCRCTFRISAATRRPYFLFSAPISK